MATDIDIASGQPRTREVPAVRMEAVYKYYGEFTALNEIDLKVERGERIVVCGPSGSGKSTLIRCINHIEKHDQGLIYVNGTELDVIAPAARFVGGSPHFVECHRIVRIVFVVEF